jgi:membrane associated rhomboid family serine protease
MFPIRDTIRSRSFPIINWLLVAVNAVVFFIEVSMPEAKLNSFINTFALVPSKLDLSNPFTWYPLVTHMFLHGGWMHVISNLWVLVIFGDNVEDRMGSFRYLIFYLFGGIAAGILQATLSFGSTVPSLGASGAIAAVMGAYFLFFPRSKVVTFIPLGFIPWFVDIPAILYLGFWFASQFFSGILSITGTGASGGIAWWAHIGGFLFGLVMGWFFTLGKRKPAWHKDEYYPW